MSWVRTATALIGFGFTIFQFLYRFNKTPGVEAPEFPWAPWFLGLGLIGTGLVALIISVWEYQSLVRYLWERDFKPVAGVSESRSPHAGRSGFSRIDPDRNFRFCRRALASALGTMGDADNECRVTRASDKSETGFRFQCVRYEGSFSLDTRPSNPRRRCSSLYWTKVQ